MLSTSLHLTHRIAGTYNINHEFDDLNLTNPKQVYSGEPKSEKDKTPKKDSEGDFSKFPLYLMLEGGVLIIYSTLAPSDSPN